MPGFRTKFISGYDKHRFRGRIRYVDHPQMPPSLRLSERDALPQDGLPWDAQAHSRLPLGRCHAGKCAARGFPGQCRNGFSHVRPSPRPLVAESPACTYICGSSLTMRILKGERRDSNPRPLEPQSNALSKLSYSHRKHKVRRMRPAHLAIVAHQPKLSTCIICSRLPGRPRGGRSARGTANN